jgi:hypothetical protein
MAIPLVSGAARAFLAGTLALSLGLAPAFAHMSPPLAAAGAHQPRGFGHFPRSGFRGFNRFGFNRGFDRGFNRFGFNRFGFNRFGRHGWEGNAGNWNQLGFGGWGYSDYSPSGPAAAPAIVLGGGAPPAVINIFPGAAPDPDDYQGGCVIHKLRYDGAGNYIGERQFSNC